MFDLPLYRMEVVYGIDEVGDPSTSCIFENLVEPDREVPSFHKMGLVGEAKVFALADTFEPIPSYDPEDEEDF